jgi:hypothetical protein
MSALNDHQFEILPGMDASDGVVFGIGAHVSMDAEGFHPGATSWAVQDSTSPFGHMAFGRDALQGPVWAWDLHVNRDEEHDALETLSAITTAWRALHIRRTPGAMLAIRYQLDGRARRIYGRPGKFEGSPNNLILSGFVPIVCDFQAVDGYVYDDIGSSAILVVGESDAGAGGGGFTFPLTFPIQTQAPTEQQSQIYVGGDAPTSPVVRFNGPITNPRLETDEWALSLNYDIPAGQYIEVDTRPWNIRVMLNGDTPIPGAIGRRQKLYDMKLQPGALDMRFIGSSSSGTATCEIRWHNAYNSI